MSVGIDTSASPSRIAADEQLPTPAGDAVEQGRLVPHLDDEDDQEVLITDYQTLDYPDPIEHGHGTQVVTNDMGDAGTTAETFYHRLFEAWRDRVGDPEKEPYVLVEDVHTHFEWLHDEFPADLVLQSKGWKAGTSVDPQKRGPNAGAEALNGQYYEYSLQVMRKTDDGELDAAVGDALHTPVSYQTWVQPQDESLVMPSGTHLTCQYGEGTRFKTQTTYASSQDTVVRTIEVVSLAADALGIARPDWQLLNRDSWRVWKGEVHHRFDDEQMPAVVKRLREAKSMLEVGSIEGDVDGDSQMTGGRHVEEKVRSDGWDRLGFLGFAARDHVLGLKVYRMGSNPRDERLAEPKLEAFYSGTAGDERLPHVDEWAALRATLRQLCSTFAIKAGITLGQLREDDYYKPRNRARIDTYVPDGWRHCVQEANETRLRRILNSVYSAVGTTSKWDLLYTIATLNGATYEKLAEVTGFTVDYVQELVAEFVEDDVLVRFAMPRIIDFDNRELRVNALDELRAVHPDRGLEDIRADAEKRRERRETQREADAADDSGEEDDAGDAASSGASADDSDDGSRWTPVAQLDYATADVLAYVEQGDIAADEIAVDTDRHDWLILR